MRADTQEAVVSSTIGVVSDQRDKRSVTVNNVKNLSSACFDDKESSGTGHSAIRYYLQIFTSISD